MANEAGGSSVYGLFDHGDKEIFAINTVFLVFAVASVVGRFWARNSRQPWLIPEDLLVVGSLITYVSQCGLVYAMCLWGNVGDRNRSPEQSSFYMRMLFGIQFPWGIELSLIRASIITFQLRIFGVIKWFRWLGYSILALIISWTIMIIVVALTICQPIRKGWDPLYPGHCADIKASYEAIAGSGIVLDVMIFTAPIPIIWRLQMSIPRRVLLNILFLVGLFDIVCGAMRLVALTKGVMEAPVSAQVWATIEPSVAIFVASTLYGPGVYLNTANYIASSGSFLGTKLRKIRMKITGKQEWEKSPKFIEQDSQDSSRLEPPNSMELSTSQERDLSQMPEDKEDFT